MKAVTKPIQLRWYQRALAYCDRHISFLLAFAAAITSVIATTYYFKHGDILAYGDAESHINIAKRVVSGATSGFGQLGGVWLPLHHMLLVPFVINDYLWRTGLGGAIASGVCYVASVLFIYKLALLLTRHRASALLATAIYGLNPNVLYMMTTPLSELPLLAFLLGSSYFFIKYLLTEDIRLLLLAGTLSFGGVLIRYDAWFLVLVELMVFVANGVHKKWPYKKIEGMTLLFLLPCSFGIILWVIWCLLIFHNPFYFLNGPYSAHSQQLAFITRGQLLTYHSFYQSMLYYTFAVIDNVGWLFSATALLGLFALIFVQSRISRRVRILLVAVLLAPFVFNVVSLYFGISILLLPSLTPASFQFHLFNVRYGMMSLPAAALLTAYLFDKLDWRKTYRLVIALSAIVIIVFAGSYPITLRDGVSGLSARVPGKAADSINTAFRQQYDYGYVAFDDFGKTANAVDLGIPMNKILYVGSHPYWDEMLKKPNVYARYIIMRPGDVLWEQFAKNTYFHTHYTQIANRKGTLLYRCTLACRPNAPLVKGD